jgi:hypothetical protein
MLLLLAEMELDPCIFYERLEYPSRGLEVSHSSLETKLRGNSKWTEDCQHCKAKFVDFSLL